MTGLHVVSLPALDNFRGTQKPGGPRAPEKPKEHSDWLDFQQPGDFSNFFFCLHFQNKEIEELTKICDELIAKMGKS